MIAADKKIVVGVCYRAPDSSEENDDNLLKLIDKFGSNKVLVMGDFNFAQLDWSDSSKIDVSHPFVETLGRNFLQRNVDVTTRGNSFFRFDS